MPKLKNFQETFGKCPNQLLNDSNISLKAKGLFTYMQSKPDNWDFTIVKLTLCLKEGEEAIKSALAELKENGWLEITNFQNEKGQWDSEYQLFATPTEEKPAGENPPTDITGPAKPPYIIKKERKKKEKKEGVEEEPADFSYFSKSEEQIKKLEVVESDEIVTPPITFEETDDLLSLLTQYLPQVIGTPHCPEIIKILESKGEHKTPYLKFVAQNKAEKWFELAGWKNWFWQDYLSNSYRTDDKKLIDKDEAESDRLKTEELNRKIEELKNKPFLEL